MCTCTQPSRTTDRGREPRDDGQYAGPLDRWVIPPACFAPQPGLADIERLARGVGGWPRVDVQVAGDFAALSPGLGVALYRIAQESVTNAVRHARDATRITVRVADEDEQVRLTVRDDGAAGPTGHTQPRYGLLGMAERASLLGGTLQAGPDADGGWTVSALLPEGVVTI